MYKDLDAVYKHITTKCTDNNLLPITTR